MKIKLDENLRRPPPIAHTRGRQNVNRPHTNQPSNGQPGHAAKSKAASGSSLSTDKVAGTSLRKSKSVSGSLPSERPSRPTTGAGSAKLAALKRAHFSKKGRKARIARAQQALLEIEKIGSTFKLDGETLKWLAEAPDLEYL